MSTINSWHMIGATLLGVIGAAGILIIEHFRQERRRHVLTQDLARMDRQLSLMRMELDQIRQLQNKNEKKSKKSKKRVSLLSSTTTSTEDYRSVGDLDSSDQEFYDLSDEDVIFNNERSFDSVLMEIDSNLNSGKVDVIKESLVIMNNLLMEHPKQTNLLCRIAKAYYHIAMSCTDLIDKQAFINKGIEVCLTALEINSQEPETHKWYAILIGSRSDFQSAKDRISDGHLFKKHIDIAIQLNPTDPSLHHLLGRFAYEVAGLKWYERKAAAVLFGEPPNATYEEALNHFFKAEDLSKQEWKENRMLIGKCHKQEWKENRMLIGKCHIANGDYQDGIIWLTKAVNIIPKDEIEEQFDSEIKTLLAKYNSYR